MLAFLYQVLHQNLTIFYVCIVSTQFHFLLDPNSSMPTQPQSSLPHTSSATKFPSELERDAIIQVPVAEIIYNWSYEF